MKALLLDADQRTASVKDIPDPTPAPNELRIRVKAVALNPVDSLYVFNPLGATGRVIGSDFAGIVDSLGDTVPAESRLKVGSRVAGFLQGACSVNERPGAFGEYAVCPWDLVWHVGDGLRLEDAAAISLCGLTAAQALYFRMKLPVPFKSQDNPSRNAGLEIQRRESADISSFFIYGASTSVGMYAAQLIRRSSEFSGRDIRLLGTASQKHSDILKAGPYYYTETVDYHDEDWPSKILNLTGGTGVDYAYDCISEGSTVSDTGRTLKPTGKMAIVRSREGGAWTAQDLPVEPSYVAVWEGLGEPVQYQGMSLPTSREAREFAVAFYTWLSEGGKLEPNPIRLMPGGLESITDDGLALLGSGTMGDRKVKSEKEWMRPLSAEKMVYTITAE